MSQRSACTGHSAAAACSCASLPPLLLCRAAFRVHVSSHQHHSTTTTLPTALPPSTPFLQLPLSCARQLLDRATTDLTTDHCHCHLTAASLNRQLTAAYLLPNSKSSASLSDRIRLAQQASTSHPKLPTQSSPCLDKENSTSLSTRS
jgi:hypothetical protein